MAASVPLRGSHHRLRVPQLSVRRMTNFRRIIDRHLVLLHLGILIGPSLLILSSFYLGFEMPVVGAIPVEAFVILIGAPLAIAAFVFCFDPMSEPPNPIQGRRSLMSPMPRRPFLIGSSLYLGMCWLGLMVWIWLEARTMHAVETLLHP